MEKEIKEKLSEYFEKEGKDHQIKALKHLLSDMEEDLLFLPDGSYGKSLVYLGYGNSLVYQAFPLLYRDLVREKCASLVLMPLKIRQTEQMDNLKERCIPSCRIDMNGIVMCNLCQDKCNCCIGDVMQGKYMIVFAHPGSLFPSEKGQQLLQAEEFINIVKGVLINECQVFDKW